MEVDLRDANELFHDVESNVYDDKWGILYDEENALRVRRKFEKLLGGPFPHVKRLLEVGCGTGYIGLNLCYTDGQVEELYACDISRGMVESCRRNACRLGINVNAKRSELEDLKYPDEEFDMVVGHAVLHHIPDVEKAFSEIYRVLEPGGICMLAGEPTRIGDLLGRLARKGTSRGVEWYAGHGGFFGGVPARLRPETPSGDGDGVSELESVVDIHTFKPARVCRQARSVGFSEVHFESEELVSSFVGWITRTIENQLAEENLTFRWRYWSYNTYLRLSRLDERIYPFIPSSWFYNMLLFMRKPE
ncbi:MAG: class I SAM-dependent methyltransferase [Actinobacteria bacterium]|nr:class I SAM-dependent methyltransferase [Actinomycetota bacterium]